MAIDFSRLRVEKLIVHEIPRKAEDSDLRPILSTIETKLSSEEKRYFTRKITDNLSLASLSAKFRAEAESPVPVLIVKDFFYSENENNFVEMSQKMANYLYECQTRVNSPGLLAVIKVLVVGKPGLVILKLEKEEGIRIEQTESNGEVTFDIKYVNNILLSQKSRVFKAGLFYSEVEDENFDNVAIYVSDNQNTKYSKNQVASFFLEDFLGCKLRENPNVLTQKFYQETSFFIDNYVENPEEKATYYLGLFAEIRSGDNYISPETFSDKYVERSKKHNYLKHLHEAGVPTNEFPKNTELIRDSPKLQIVLNSGIIIISPSGAYQENLKLSGHGDGNVHIEIDDRLKRFKGK